MKIGYVKLTTEYTVCTLAGNLLARDGFVTADQQRQARFSDEEKAIEEALRICRKRKAQYVGEIH